MNSIDIVAVARHLGLKPLKKNGSTYARCPVNRHEHDHSNPRCGLNTEKGVWNCLKCGESGDAVGLVKAVRGCEAKEAFQWLEENGLKVDSKLRSRLKDICPDVDPILQLAGVRGWTQEAQAALGAEAKGALVRFPMKDAAGEVTGHKLRRGDNEKVQTKTGAVKSKTEHGGKNGLIYPDDIRERTGPVIIVESEADGAAILSVWPRAAVIATPGATPGWACFEYVAALAEAREVILAPDPDVAGETWRDKMGRALEPVAAEVRVIEPDGTGDIDERLRGGEKLDEMVEAAVEWKAPEDASALMEYIPPGREPKGKYLYHAAAEFLDETGDFVPVETQHDAELFGYCGGLWTPAAMRLLRQRLKDLLAENNAPRALSEVKHRLLSGQIMARDAMGLPAGKVAVANGLLDVRTGKLRPLRRADRALWRLPVEYDPAADCPEIDAFLRDVVPRPEHRATIWEFMGYALQPRCHFKKALMLFGPQDAGKSVLLFIMRCLFGRENDATATLQELVNEKWAAAELYGKPINTRSDLSTEVIYHTGLFKELTAGDSIRTQRKYGQPFSFEPQTKFAFAANQAPARSTEDNVFWGRWLTLVFPRAVPEAEQDKSLPLKLTRSGELSGALNRALEGLARLEREAGFSYAPTAVETQQIWFGYGDSLEAFLARFVTSDPDGWAPKEHVYKLYTEFAAGQNDEVVSKQKVTREIQKLGASVGQRRVKGERPRTYEGISFDVEAYENYAG